MSFVQQGPAGLRSKPFTGCGDFAAPWGETDFLAVPARVSDRYLVGFARSDACVEAAQRLRYEVFNVELGEGLAESVHSGLDRDGFDDHMVHLVLVERDSGEVAGTYRMQAVRDALTGGGIYSAQEYDLEPLRPYFDELLELGRACLAARHRNFRAMIAMWLGIGAYMNAHDLQYLFGCCSLTTQNPDDGWRALQTIRRSECLHSRLFLRARSEYSCGDPGRETDLALGDDYKLPKLFRTYLRLGAQVISEPAIDRAFGTIDFLVLLNGKRVALSSLDVLK